MIRLSATAISDFLECPKRLWYRTNHPDASEVSDHVVFGQIIHEAIEKFTTADDAISWSESEWPKRWVDAEFAVISKKTPKSFSKQLRNYFNLIEPKIDRSEFNKKEMFFRIPYKWKEPVEIIGKIDRVTNSVWDWKTGLKKPSRYELQDIQFYTYAWAYKKLYNRYPESVYFGHLQTGTIHKVTIKQVLLNNFERTVNYVLENLNKEPILITGYQCNTCFYKEICYAEQDGSWTKY